MESGVAGKAAKHPRYRVISLRISEEERRHLDTLITGKGKSVSDVMREALEHYTTCFYEHA